MCGFPVDSAPLTGPACLVSVRKDVPRPVVTDVLGVGVWGVLCPEGLPLLSGDREGRGKEL